MKSYFSPGMLRWGLLLIPLWGLIDNGLPLWETDRNFIWLSLIATAALVLLLTRLNREAKDSLWVWIGLLVFIQGYFVKSYWAAGNIDSGRWASLQPELAWMSVQTVTDGYYWIVLAFVVFCLTSTFWLGMQPARTEISLPKQAPDLIRPGFVLGAMLLTFMLYVLASYVQGRLGIGVMGVEYERLPYRLDTIIFRFRSNLVPAILFLGVWIFDLLRRTRAHLITLALLLATALIDSVITASRASFIRILLPVFLIWLVSGRLTRQRKLFLLVIAFLTLVVYPFITTYRYIRVVKAEDTVMTSITFAVDVVMNQGLESSYESSANAMQTRVTGAEGVWFIMSHLPDEFSAEQAVNMLFFEDMTAYFTRQIVGVRGLEDWRSLGLVGTGMLLGGWVAVILHVLLYFSGVYFIWRYLSRLRTAPVMLGLFALTLFIHVGDGGSIIPPLGALLVSVLSCELLYRQACLPGAAVSPRTFYPLPPRQINSSEKGPDLSPQTGHQ